MEKKFTKGEWHVDGFNLTAVISEVGPHAFYHVCDCKYGYLDPEKYFELNKANAKLIAAAPDMLEALDLAQAELRAAYKRLGYLSSNVLEAIDKAMDKALS